MDVARDMCRITVDNAGERVRYFAAAPAETGKFEPLHVRDDLAWNPSRQREVLSEYDELLAKESYEEMMGAENVNQIIKVADAKILFTGFIEDLIVVASFERGIFPVLDDIVEEFADYVREHDVDFVALEA